MITGPGAGAQTLFATALLDSEQPCPPGLRAWNGSDPTRRMAVYRNNVISSLVDALAHTFPVVQQLVGEAFFRAMAAVFVRQSPPRSRVLAHYGGDLPEFIEGFAPARSVPYLADMARLELARVSAYHAADAPALAGESVSQALASGDRMPELRLRCHPSLAIIESRFAVVSLWAAHQGEGDLATVDPDQAEAAIVLRQGLDVLTLRAPPGAAEFMTAIGRGQNLGDAASQAASAHANFDLSATLTLLLSHEALTAIHLPQVLDS